MQQKYRVRGLLVLAAIVIVGLIVFVQSRRSTTANSDGVQIVDTARVEPAPVGTTAAAEPALAADPLATVLAGAPPEARRLHDQLAAQVHDAATAQTEQRMTSAIPAGLKVAAQGEVKRVSCSATLCEIVGAVAESPDVVQRDLTNPLWLDPRPRLGYAPGPTAVAEENGKTTFLLYIVRRT